MNSKKCAKGSLTAAYGAVRLIALPETKLQGAIRTERSDHHKNTTALDDKIAIPNGTPMGPLRLHRRFETTARIWHPISDPSDGTLNIFTHDWNPNPKQIGERANL